ncbi:MAG: ATPase, T2SS/T4P/T4SS family [Deltaproteobacteria bacterium]
MAPKPMRIGEILVIEGVVTKQQVENALKVGGARVGKTLVKLGYVTDEEISKALAHQFNLEFVTLQNTIIESAVIVRLHEAIARKHIAIPIAMEGGILKVAIADPLNVLTIDELQRAAKLKLKLAVATEDDILKAIDRHYVAAKSIEEVAKSEDLGRLELLEEEAENTDKLLRIADEESVVRLVNMIISRATEDKASDIHIEPNADILRIRYRIDGILHDAANLPIKLHPAVTSRIKILSGMDIAEKRRPQDGRFITKAGNREIDMRISTLPTMLGEKVEIRLLDKGAMLTDLEDLSPSNDSIETLNSLIKRPYGMILITGPTGSGKSSTIYALLGQLDAVAKNIVTVEDPVEYQVKRINQVQVNPKAGLTFADALRHILRQDPNVIMIGEIRDRETAEIAVHAALTGHLVFTTLHTTDAAGAVSRLIDMGVEPFLVSSAVIGIASQRLVRKICPDCKKSYSPDEAILEELDLPKTTLFYRGEGCKACKNEGYRGRTAIIEVLRMGEALRKLTLEKVDSVTIRMQMKEMGFPSLRVEGIKAVVAGVTTFEEVIRATQEIVDME